MIKSLSTADRNERAVAYYINQIEGVSAERPIASVSYSDVKVSFRDEYSWVEVKLNENDQLGTPRVSYDGEKWVGKKSPLHEFTSQQLNQSGQATQFLTDLSEFIGTDDYILPTTKGGLSDSKAVSLEDMAAFLELRDNNYLHREEDVYISNVVAEHYNYGKKEPVHYIQLGDQFFRLGDHNPLNLPAPKFEQIGPFKVRCVIRSEFYEFMPEMKVSGEIYSPYSVAPGTLKPHPFGDENDNSIGTFKN